MAEERKRIVQRKEVVVNLPIIHAPGWMQGFIDFIREQGVVGLAVGLTLGLAAKSLVDTFVSSIINPLAGIFYGGGGQLGAKFWCLKHIDGKCTNKLGYGGFLNELINFIIIVAVVYFVVKKLKLDKLDKPKVT